MTRVVLVDDHPVFRRGLAALLAEDGVVIVAEVGTASAALASVAEHEPDVLVLDLHLPDGSGIDVARDVAATAPETRVLVLTMDSADVTAIAALRAGARGFLLKEAAAESIGAAVAALVRGEVVLDAKLADRLPALLARSAPDPSDLVPLSARELDVLRLVARGLGNAEIGRKLFLAEKTIRNNITAVLAKTATGTRPALIAYAHNFGID